MLEKGAADSDLRKQSKEYFMHGGAAHNRRSTSASMNELGHRRDRRRWTQRLQQTVSRWNDN